MSAKFGKFCHYAKPRLAKPVAATAKFINEDAISAMFVVGFIYV